jgi:hypothetical protein
MPVAVGGARDRLASSPSRDVASLVTSLRAVPPTEVGTPAWWNHVRAVERLNATLHGACVNQTGSTAVGDAFTACPAATDAVVTTLLVAEAFRERVLPHVGALVRQLCAMLRCAVTSTPMHSRTHALSG